MCIICVLFALITLFETRKWANLWLPIVWQQRPMEVWKSPVQELILEWSRLHDTTWRAFSLPAVSLLRTKTSPWPLVFWSPARFSPLNACAVIWIKWRWIKHFPEPVVCDTATFSTVPSGSFGACWVKCTLKVSAVLLLWEFWLL